jgi:hypothetical protein
MGLELSFQTKHEICFAMVCPFPLRAIRVIWIHWTSIGSNGERLMPSYGISFFILFPTCLQVDGTNSKWFSFLAFNVSRLRLWRPSASTLSTRLELSTGISRQKTFLSTFERMCESRTLVWVIWL